MLGDVEMSLSRELSLRRSNQSLILENVETGNISFYDWDHTFCFYELMLRDFNWD